MSALSQGIERARRGVGAGGVGVPAPRPRRKPTRGGLTMVLFVLPSVIILLLLNVYPLLYAGMQSLRHGNLIVNGPWVGLQNYGSVLTDSNFWRAAVFTLIFTVSGVFGSWVVGLALAMLLRTKIPAGGLFKVLLLLPWVVPVVVSATSWNWLVATPQSPLPILLSAIGFHNVLFLSNPVLAKIVVCVFKVWISFPFMMMMMSAALTGIDVNVYEAAKVDGATGWQSFRSITMPLISRSTYISWILMTIFCVNDFPTIYLLSGGGPTGATTSLVVLAYQTVFQNLQSGPGVAIAFLMSLVLILVSVFLYRQIKKVNVG